MTPCGTAYLVCSSNLSLWTKSYGVTIAMKPHGTAYLVCSSNF